MTPIPELAGLSDAEDFFEALGVRWEPRVIEAHRLHILRSFGRALEAWLDANPGAGSAARRAAAAAALGDAHAAFADEVPRCNPFAPGLVRLRRG